MCNLLSSLLCFFLLLLPSYYYSLLLLLSLLWCFYYFLLLLYYYYIYYYYFFYLLRLLLYYYYYIYIITCFLCEEERRRQGGPGRLAVGSARARRLRRPRSSSDAMSMRRPRSEAVAESESTDSIKALKSFYARRKYSSFADENGGGSDRHRKRRKHVGLRDATNAPRASYEHKFNEDECDSGHGYPMKNRKSHGTGRGDYECKYSDEDHLAQNDCGMPLITPRYNHSASFSQHPGKPACTAPRKQRKSYEENVVPETARLLGGSSSSRYSNNPNSAKSICAQLRIAQMEMDTVMESEED